MMNTIFNQAIKKETKKKLWDDRRNFKKDWKIPRIHLNTVEIKLK